MALRINAQKGPTKYPSSISLGFTLSDANFSPRQGTVKKTARMIDS